MWAERTGVFLIGTQALTEKPVSIDAYREAVVLYFMRFIKSR
jgi:hypothetical protein